MIFICVISQISVYEAWVHSKQLHHLVLHGGSDSEQIHPYFNLLFQNIMSDTEQMQNAKDGIVPRPKPPMYTSIVQEMQQFVDSFGSYSKAQAFSTMLTNLLTNTLTSSSNISSIPIQCKNWLDCHRNFVLKLSKKFWYWDITAPFLSASIHVSFNFVSYYYFKLMHYHLLYKLYFHSKQASAGYQLVYDNIQKYFSNSKINLTNILLFPTPFHEQRINIAGIYEEKWAYQKSNKK